MADQGANSHEGRHAMSGFSLEVTWYEAGDWHELAPDMGSVSIDKPGWYWASSAGVRGRWNPHGPFNTSFAAFKAGRARGVLATER